MIKAIALGNNFLLTAIASSFLCWLASLHPSLLLFVQALFALKPERVTRQLYRLLYKG
jgi:small multidrug resistance family-3 protein